MPLIVCDCQCKFGRDGQCELDKAMDLGLPAFCPRRPLEAPGNRREGFPLG
ncbi:hypothetical protein [Thermanaeromonas sp. C210]|uniref:hypothetical protein n=1 Tax=Thermanaeromonas sp. C210 TaxID=2731925 RepID=UPI00155D0DCB|nr:hypothetical protein [Thermanaeromonas sp. C210]GFN21884.1 hypothetical protein TAMC210_02000 [Thermanaeromonas sp. C210]